MANIPILISLNEAARRTSLSRTAINRLRVLGKFPRAVPLCDRRVGFVEEEVSQWIQDRVAKRDELSSGYD